MLVYHPHWLPKFTHTKEGTIISMVGGGGGGGQMPHQVTYLWIFFCGYFYSMKILFEHPYNPSKMLDAHMHISTWVPFVFSKMCINLLKLQTSVIMWTHHNTGNSHMLPSHINSHFTTRNSHASRETHCLEPLSKNHLQLFHKPAS